MKRLGFLGLLGLLCCGLSFASVHIKPFRRDVIPKNWRIRVFLEASVYGSRGELAKTVSIVAEIPSGIPVTYVLAKENLNERYDVAVLREAGLTVRNARVQYHAYILKLVDTDSRGEFQRVLSELRIKVHSDPEFPILVCNHFPCFGKLEMATQEEEQRQNRQTQISNASPRYIPPRRPVGNPPDPKKALWGLGAGTVGFLLIWSQANQPVAPPARPSVVVVPVEPPVTVPTPPPVIAPPQAVDIVWREEFLALGLRLRTQVNEGRVAEFLAVEVVNQIELMRLDLSSAERADWDKIATLAEEVKQVAERRHDLDEETLAALARLHEAMAAAGPTPRQLLADPKTRGPAKWLGAIYLEIQSRLPKKLSCPASVLEQAP